MKDIRNKLNQVIRARDSYNKKSEELEELLKPKCLFRMGLSNMPGDGLCILNQETNDTAPLSSCLSIIFSRRSAN